MDTRAFFHEPVLLSECLDALNIRPDGVYADGTAGGGGHSSAIAERLSKKGRLICLDKDEDALKACKARLAPYSDRTVFVKRGFSELAKVLRELGIPGLDGLLLDLGVSSYQLDEPSRGFSYMSDAPLDMRMDRQSGLTAYDIVNRWERESLAGILRDYGEERYASSIAASIVKERAARPIRTTAELASVIASAIPSKARREEQQHPAKRSFQAIRIAVNDELGELERLMKTIPDILNASGRAAVITFHSLEDRIVKRSFADMAASCVCPPDFPVCVCNHRPLVRIITKRPVLPTYEEIARNPRARSAKLRVCERSDPANGQKG